MNTPATAHSQTQVRQDPWEDFAKGDWVNSINVRDFIQRNYLLHDGDSQFLAPPTARTKALWAQVLELIKAEQVKQAPLDFDAETPAGVTAHAPGYIDPTLEVIVGLQTDEPLKRAIVPWGGLRMVQTSCEVYGKKLNPVVEEIFTKYRKTHNAGVFDAYTPDIMKCRKVGIITGLPDAYGRGRIIGD